MLKEEIGEKVFYPKIVYFLKYFMFKEIKYRVRDPVVVIESSWINLIQNL